jgi:Ca2+-binding RTX toxin-like protein
MRKVSFTVIIGTVLALTLVPQAVASTVTVTGGNTVRVVETGTEVNRVSTSFDAGTDLYTVLDGAANLNATGTCIGIDAHRATCPGAGIKTISVDTDALNDSIDMDLATIPSAVLANFDGGSGDDTIAGHGSLNGESGNDHVAGSPLADTVRGGSGRDTIDAGDGADDIAGGSGTDTLFYPYNRPNGVNVTVGSGNFNDGGPEDQTGSRRDAVHGDIEELIGTLQNDVLVGDQSGELLSGLPGDDLLIGNGGGDTLLGFAGNDLLIGGAGNDLGRGGLGLDRLLGKSGADRLTGDLGNDFLRGGAGRDVMKGKRGIDRINAHDGRRDVKINCGPGGNGAEGAKRDRHLDPPAKSC